MENQTENKDQEENKNETSDFLSSEKMILNKNQTTALFKTNAQIPKTYKKISFSDLSFNAINETYHYVNNETNTIDTTGYLYDHFNYLCQILSWLENRKVRLTTLITYIFYYSKDNPLIIELSEDIYFAIAPKVND